MNLLEHINELIKEHKEAGFCCNYTRAMDELCKDVQNAFDYAYDVGRYDTLLEIKSVIERGE